jgi:hypothetical protein
VVGVDPGINNVVTFFDSETTGKCSSKEYYHESLSNWTRYKQNRRYEKQPRHYQDFILAPSRNSAKTSNLEEFCSHLSVLLAGLDFAVNLHL